MGNINGVLILFSTCITLLHNSLVASTQSFVCVSKGQGYYIFILYLLYLSHCGSLCSHAKTTQQSTLVFILSSSSSILIACQPSSQVFSSHVKTPDCQNICLILQLILLLVFLLFFMFLLPLLHLLVLVLLLFFFSPSLRDG